MKKTVLAFAVAAAMGVPAVAAADTTLYGRFNVSLDAVDNGATSQTMLTNNSSRVGIRGSEDLGGGLRGVFQVEGAFGGSGTAFNGGWGSSRNTFVGLAGDFGEVRLGRHDTPYKLSTLSLNFFADTLGDMYNIFGGIPVADVVDPARSSGAADQFYDRRDNTILYMSPNFEGFRAMVSYTTDASDDRVQTGTAGDNRIVSLAGVYTQGPLMVTAAYQKNDEQYGAEDGKAWKIGGTYRIDDLTLAAGYESIDNGPNSRGAFHVGARYSLGQAYLMGSYTQANDLDNNDGAKMYALGAGYNLSRRTGVYAVYAQLKNDANVETAGLSYNMNRTGSGKGFNTAVGEDTSKGFQVGVFHNF